MKQRFWWLVGVPKCIVRVMSVVPHSYWPPESSSSIVVLSTTLHVSGLALRRQRGQMLRFGNAGGGGSRHELREISVHTEMR